MICILKMHHLACEKNLNKIWFFSIFALPNRQPSELYDYICFLVTMLVLFRKSTNKKNKRKRRKFKYNQWMVSLVNIINLIFYHYCCSNRCNCFYLCWNHCTFFTWYNPIYFVTFVLFVLLLRINMFVVSQYFIDFNLNCSHNFLFVFSLLSFRFPSLFFYWIFPLVFLIVVLLINIVTAIETY